ncbi:AzlC family ABC transporter permease [Phyllobacterium sp. 21LDTY02-6]|uniref:AzlC family ABC transporter permease n=1 Tax=unclassified Phyllobacterium TaxID=2638441 RepID=UPI0020200129|nr:MULTISPECIES: AzlC family ABC transporter permease [unclassified Phyllobacterium]MCO4316494.1 AzlC family ABC transporter permease [Phyllobacterium sp. 21LDTY02-6]MCX8280704.1 AzlC family ABC transporter permease [Phyllobacterium sp. 0TCS1.6C]MCX8292719.1 AzlC family ABC transporter permease [Phyllobacterium sp. 0TCS1.6A]
MADSGPSLPVESRTKLSWFLSGAALTGSIPALILMTAHVGFAGFASENGLPMIQAAFMVAAIWALPANIVLIGAIAGDYSIVAAAIAVGLSSIRLMPMVAAFVPEIRGPNTRRISLLLLSHFIAITAWVIGMERLKNVPAEMRVVFFAGIGITLTTANTLVVALVYLLSASFPPLVFACLFFLTPMYFLASLWGSARDRSIHVAMVSGLILFPAIHAVAPAYDLLLTGAIGGLVTMAYVRWSKGRAAT